MGFKQRVYKALPDFFQNILIGIFNKIEYSKRYGGKYEFYKSIFKAEANLSYVQLKELQERSFNRFLKKSIETSSYYRQKYSGIKLPSFIDEISNLPIISKEELRENINSIYTIEKRDSIVSKTGGTTGISLEVRYSKENIQERFALIDNFRERFGYKLGKKTAWFSGKALLGLNDIKKRRFWKTDYFNGVRYYSTFHIKDDYLKHYVQNLLTFAPEYIVGFPSSLMEIAKYGLKNNIRFPHGIVKAIFPTAETITPEIYDVLGRFFNTKVLNQYASSEGAPFIFECENGKLHFQLTSGVFEVLDDQNVESDIGRLVVTSFTTAGTPLIRYDIGDVIEKESGTCGCGNNNPLVKHILGRVDDYVYSPQNGKINLGNVSNSTKGTKGIVKFQVVQRQLDAICIHLVVDSTMFTEIDKQTFIDNWRERVGSKMLIDIAIVNEIGVEKSGKFRIVKNYIKNQIDN